MNNKTITAAVLLVGGALAASGAYAQVQANSQDAPSGLVAQGMNHDAHNMGAMSVDLTKLKGKAFDRAFLSMMIAHHQGAIDMSKATIGRAKDPQVKKWANEIISAQQKEIQDMTAWAKVLGGVDTKAQGGMMNDMNSMTAALKSSKDADRALVEGMLPHHASAIDMANLALQRSDDPRILKLARDIIQLQADEMYAYRQWLLRR